MVSLGSTKNVQKSSNINTKKIREEYNINEETILTKEKINEEEKQNTILSLINTGIVPILKTYKNYRV